MQAITYHAYGPADVLRLEEVPQPELRTPHDILVRVRAASVNPADCKRRSGAYTHLKPSFPFIPGRDFSGQVVAAGAKSDLRPGDEVFGVKEVGQDGACAQYLVVDCRVVARRPANLGDDEAAAIALVALTALVSVEDTLKVEKGERVLVQGGAGGVGGMAIQLAKARGAWVATTARTANHEYVHSLGADVAIDYTQANVSQVLGGLDAVLDTVGGPCVPHSFAVLSRGGRAAFINFQAPAAPDDRVTVLKPVVLRSRELMKRVLAHLAAGNLRAPQIVTMPLAEAARAHALSEAGHVRGKLVLLP